MQTVALVLVSPFYLLSLCVCVFFLVNLVGYTSTLVARAFLTRPGLALLLPLVVLSHAPTGVS